MHFLNSTAFSLGFIHLFWSTTFCAPTQPIHPSQLETSCGGLFTDIANPLNSSNSAAPDSTPTRGTRRVSIDHGSWKISDTMTLGITICNWEPDPATIQAVLIAALAAVGKKPAAGLLERKFTQRSNNRYNTLLFEISSHYIHNQLTWGDVGEVVGEHGLLEFFQTTQRWNTVYFTLVHATRGELGNGAVRRWWQLEAPDTRNEAASDGPELSVG